MKNNTIIKSILIVLISIVVGTLALVCVYSLPTKRIEQHLNESTSLYNQDENKVDNWIGYLRYAKIDNYTDALMLNAALCREGDNTIENALLNPHYTVSSELANELGHSNISLFLNEKTITGVAYYSRYWHGYLLYLIPCLLLCNVGGVRVIMMFVQFLLAMLLLYKISQISPIHMFAYAVTFLFINPITTVLNFQNADVYIISMLASIAVLYLNDWLKENNRYPLIFTLIGVLTSYFDFLTYPLVSWGIPMITMLLINKKDLKEQIKTVICCAIAWAFGYAGMWAGKWLVTSIFTDVNVFTEAFSAIVQRSSSIDNVGEAVSFAKAIDLFVESVNDVPMMLLLILSLSIISLYMFFNKKLKNLCLDNLKGILVYLLVGLAPFVWAFVIRNHFSTHQFLEYRTMAVSVLAILISLIEMFNPKDKDY